MRQFSAEGIDVKLFESAHAMCHNDLPIVVDRSLT